MGNGSKLKISKKLVLLLFLLFIVIDFQKISVKATEINKNVLIINSYSKGFYWTDGECEGILDTLNSEENVIKYVEYMDWKRYNTEENLNKLYDYYKYKYSGKKIDLIITTDDAALNFAIKYRKELFSDAPLVFGGVNKEPADTILKDVTNVTGIYETTYPEATINAALKMKPKTKKLYVIHDNTETGISFYNLVKNSVSLIDTNLIVNHLSNYTIDELCNKSLTLENDSIVILDAYSSDAKGLSLPMEKFSNMISKNSSVPIFTTSEILIGEGCIGGSVLSAKVHGIDIGTLALKSLNGEDINNISFMIKKSVRSIYDYNVLKKYNLLSAPLPPNSTIINKPFSFYETYKEKIYIVSLIFILLLILVIYLMINIRKRIKVEKNSLKITKKLVLYMKNSLHLKNLYK